MKLTYIQYQLPYYGIQDAVFWYHKNCRIDEVEIWEECTELREQVLYLVPYEKQEKFPIGQETVACIYDCPADGSRRIKNGFYTGEEYSLSRILNVLNRLVMDFQKWEIILQYSEEMDLNTLLDASETILRMPLAVSDNHFRFIAKGQWYRQMFPTEMLDQDEMDELIWEEEFKRCQWRNSVFHMPLKTEKKDLLCFNIFIGGKYHARVLGSVEDKQHEALQEELFTRLATAVNSIFANQRIHPFMNARNSELQKQVELLLHGEQAVDTSVFENWRWHREDSYKVMVFSFDARYPMEEGLRFLYIKLGALFPESCVIMREKDLICVRNLSLESEEENYRERLAVFLRENVAKAGSSNAFTGYATCRLYLKQAYEALRLGQKNTPYFWHYEFKDYTLQYLLEQTVKEYPPQQIVHPGLYQLITYDKEKASNLYETLKRYLESGCNATQTAETLYIHRSSLMKRLEKIRTLSGIHIEKSEDRFYVEYCIRLLEYEKKYRKQ